MEEKLEQKNAPTPRTVLRGWFHACFVPFVIGACVTLICLSPTAPKRGAAIVFMVASLMLFSMSGVYHLFNWGPKVKGILRRFDHMNIFLIIAGTYTPLAVSCLPLDPELLINGDIAWYSSGFVLLVGIWVLALLGLLVHVIWIGAPRVLYVVIYIVLGAGALIFLPAIAVSGIRFAVAVVSLIGAGGACYIIGAIFYAIKNPLRNARVFGFHELFHCLTLAAFSCHTVAIYLAALG